MFNGAQLLPVSSLPTSLASDLSVTHVHRIRRPVVRGVRRSVKPATRGSTTLQVIGSKDTDRILNELSDANGSGQVARYIYIFRRYGFLYCSVHQLLQHHSSCRVERIEFKG